MELSFNMPLVLQEKFAIEAFLFMITDCSHMKNLPIKAHNEFRAAINIRLYSFPDYVSGFTNAFGAEAISYSQH